MSAQLTGEGERRQLRLSPLLIVVRHSPSSPASRELPPLGEAQRAAKGRPYGGTEQAQGRALLVRLFSGPQPWGTADQWSALRRRRAAISRPQWPLAEGGLPPLAPPPGELSAKLTEGVPPVAGGCVPPRPHRRGRPPGRPCATRVIMAKGKRRIPPVCALGHPPLGKGAQQTAIDVPARGHETKRIPWADPHRVWYGSAHRFLARQPLRHPPRGGSADDTSPCSGEARRPTNGRPHGAGAPRRTVSSRNPILKSQNPRL